MNLVDHSNRCIPVELQQTRQEQVLCLCCNLYSLSFFNFLYGESEQKIGEANLNHWYGTCLTCWYCTVRRKVCTVKTNCIVREFNQLIKYCGVTTYVVGYYGARIECVFASI